MADPAPYFGALTADGPFPKLHISPVDFLTPSCSRFILNSKHVRKEGLVGPTSMGVNPGFVPGFLAGLAKMWPSLHLLGGWNFPPRSCTSIHSPKAQLC